MRDSHFLEQDRTVTTEHIKAPVAVAVWGVFMLAIALVLDHLGLSPAEIYTALLSP